MNVRKSDGLIEEFDSQKVKNGICKAFEATDEECDELMLENIVNSLYLKDLNKKRDFIKEYINASNAATGSKFDSNANVSNKNIVTLGQELYKENNIKQNRYILYDKIRKMFSKKLADQYIADLESHVLYKHDESGTPGYPYCVAITMYPFLVNGLKGLGGESIAPTDLKSFCGEFINLV